MQKPLNLRKIVMVLTQIRSWGCEDYITSRHPPNMKFWLILHYWYPHVRSLYQLMVIFDTHSFTHIPVQDWFILTHPNESSWTINFFLSNFKPAEMAIIIGVKKHVWMILYIVTWICKHPSDFDIFVNPADFIHGIRWNIFIHIICKFPNLAFPPSTLKIGLGWTHCLFLNTRL